MNSHCLQVSVSQRLASGQRLRRRSVPPSPSMAVSQPVNQRWRERPRRRARRLTPGRSDGVVHAIVGRLPCLRAHSVQENRAARAPMFVSSCEEASGPADAVANWFACKPASSAERDSVSRSNWVLHHRADDAGAVLGIVNALRFASTRPLAGPSGIDDACARHRLAIARWWSSDEDHHDVDEHVDRAYGWLITSVPHGTPPVRHNGIRSAYWADAPRARLERILHDIAVP